MVNLPFLYSRQKKIIGACLWVYGSDHISYCRPKLIIFQHNDLLK